MTEAVTEVVREQKLAKATTFPAMLDKFRNEIARALPRHLNPDRMCRIALTEFRKNPKLAECDPRSVFAAIIVASQMGLEPGVLGQAYLIPYKSECQLIPGYQGLVDLVRRSGMVQRIEAHVVRHGDKFTYKSGLHTVLEHEPLLDGTPGALRLVYAVAEFRDGGNHVEVMTEDQVNRIRDRSQAVINAKRYNKTTPWDTDTEEMWRKTALRRICKFLPKSPELTMALQLEDAAAQGAQGLNVDDAVAGTWQAPVLEVTTEEQGDVRLAEKSKANLERIKEQYGQPRELRISPVPDQAERQQQAEKNGAKQSQTQEAAPAAEPEQVIAAPPKTQEVEPNSGNEAQPPAGAESTGVGSAPQNSEQPEGGLPLEFK